MKAIQATVGTSQPIVTEAELNTIFYKIPELHSLHESFLEALKKHSQKWDTRIGDHFKIMVSVLLKLIFIKITNCFLDRLQTYLYTVPS